MTGTDADAERSADTGENADAPRRPGEGFPEGTFNDWVGLRIEEVGDGEAVIAVDCEEFKQNPAGVMHGGVTATLIDVAGGVAIGSELEEEAPMMATTNLEVNYLRPITDTAYATGDVVRVGSSNAVVQVEVESTAPDGERKTVAVGTVTYSRS